MFLKLFKKLTACVLGLKHSAMPCLCFNCVLNLIKPFSLNVIRCWFKVSIVISLFSLILVCIISDSSWWWLIPLHCYSGIYSNNLYLFLLALFKSKLAFCFNQRVCHSKIESEHFWICIIYFMPANKASWPFLNSLGINSVGCHILHGIFLLIAVPYSSKWNLGQLYTVILFCIKET